METFAGPVYRPELVVVARAGQPTTTCGLPWTGGRTLTETLTDPAPVDTLLVAGGEGARGPRGTADPALLAARARRVATASGSPPRVMSIRIPRRSQTAPFSTANFLGHSPIPT